MAQNTLSDHHLAQLQASGIGEEEIRLRGYRTLVRRSDARALGFGATQVQTLDAQHPALLVPVFTVAQADAPATYQLRPDVARVSNKDGKAIKYETPTGSRMTIDIPPRARIGIGDPQRTLYFTEGVKKADSAVTRGLCCVALLGVWNWRGVNAYGGRTALGDLEFFAFNDKRPVYIVFDSDAAYKRGIHSAMAHFGKALEVKGATVRYVYLPGGDAGTKVGLDDWLRTVPAGKEQWNLHQLSTASPRRVEGEEDGQEGEDHAEYQIRPGGMFHFVQTEMGRKAMQLTNIHAAITAEVVQDDASGERTRMIELESYIDGSSNGHSKPRRFLVRADKFDTMDWVRNELGAQAIIWPGNGIKDKLRFAIQRLSGEIHERVSYTHVGWRKLEERWVYIHSGGALSCDGAVEGLRGEAEGMERYLLPEPPDGDDLRESVRRSLRYLDVAGPSQTWPVLAAIYTAPLASILPLDFVLWVVGETGGRKSTAVALALSHFGQFDRGTLPTNFDSTPNQVESMCFRGKDVPMVVDDYRISGDRKTQERMDAVADRLLRSVGDLRGRGRLGDQSQLRVTYRPRCLAIATSEVPTPGAQSSALRTFEVTWQKNSVRLDRLGQACREDATYYAQAMAAYLQYLAKSYDVLARSLPPLVRRFADRLPPSEGRIQETASKLFLGVTGFLQFACHVGAVTEDERALLLEQAWVTFESCARRTGIQQAERKPSVLFVECLRALLLKGQAYLVDRKTGECPDQEDPSFWGHRSARAGEYVPSPAANASLVGWVDLVGSHLYLDATVAHEMIVGYAQRAGLPLGGSKRALGEALERDGLLKSRYRERWEVNIRVGVNCDAPEARGKRWAWHLDLDILTPSDDPEALPGRSTTTPFSPSTVSSPEENGAPEPPDAHDMQDPENTHTHAEKFLGGGVFLKTGGTGGRAPSEVLSRHETGANRGLNLPPEAETILEAVEAFCDGDVALENPASRMASGDFGSVEAETGVGTGEYRHKTAENGAENGVCLHASSLRHPPSLPAGNYQRVFLPEIARIPEFLARLETSDRLAIDCETTGLDPRKHRLRLLQVATPEETFVFDLFQLPAEVLLPRLFPLLADRQLLGHNLGFDLSFLWQLGFRPGKCADTMLQALLLSASGGSTRKGHHSLAECCRRELGFELPKAAQRSNWAAAELQPEQLAYAARDVQVLWDLDRRQTEMLQEADLLRAYTIERRALPAVTWMSCVGVPFDAAAWQGLTAGAVAGAAALRSELDQLAPPAPELLDAGFGWNWDSPDIVKRVFALMGHELRNTGDDTLARIDHPVADLLREYRQAKHRETGFGDNWSDRVDGGRLYPTWHQLGSRAGRMSAAEPNVQQPPREKAYRACFRPDAGRVLVKADYSQIELRIAAAISGDERMKAAYVAGDDIHTLTARALLGRDFADEAEQKLYRQRAKAVNFGLLYGMGAETLRAYTRASYGVELTAAEAQAARTTFFRTYAGIRRWHQSQPRDAIETRTLAGRRRVDVDFFTQKLNSPVQGTGADGLKRAMALLWERRAQVPDTDLVLAVHDELVAECPADQADAVAAWLKQAMFDGMAPLLPGLPVEVEVQTGPTWAG